MGYLTTVDLKGVVYAGLGVSSPSGCDCKWNILDYFVLDSLFTIPSFSTQAPLFSIPPNRLPVTTHGSVLCHSCIKPVARRVSEVGKKWYSFLC